MKKLVNQSTNQRNRLSINDTDVIHAMCDHIDDLSNGIMVVCKLLQDVLIWSGRPEASSGNRFVRV